MSIRLLKKEELQRRVASLPTEVEAWRTATSNDLDKNAHFSQLKAIKILVDTLTTTQPAAVAALDAAGDPRAFEDGTIAVMRGIVKAQRCWDYFRDKLDQRHSPLHKEALWVADTVAWNCHRPVMDLAAQFGIIDPNHLREPPLVYCSAEYSPATWVQRQRPNDGRTYHLGEASLPIPVIEMPWDQLGNSWDYLSIHHEVGHDIEADLELRPVLQGTVQKALTAAHTPPARIGTWVKWHGEVFADLCALRLAGPAFADTLMQLLMLPAASVTTFDPEDPHPTPYLRILMNASYIRMLGTSQPIQNHAARIENEWRALYGPTAGNTGVDDCLADVQTVCDAMMNTPLAELKGHSIAELLPYKEAEDVKIRQAERFFRTGMASPSELSVRHVPSAARLAVQAQHSNGGLTQAAGSAIHTRVLQYIRQHAPPGLRGGGPSDHERFVASFALDMFEK